MIPLEWKLNLWLAFGVFVAIAWLLVVAIFVRPKTRSGMAWWVLPVVTLGVVAPLLWKAGLWLMHAAQPALYQFGKMTDWLIIYGWIFPVTLGLAALGYGAWWLWKQEKAEVAADAPEILPAAPAPAQPVQMWSLPPETPQWNADSVNR